MRRHAAAALLLLAHQARAGCEGNCAAPINVTCGSVLVVGDSTTDEYMPELRALLANLGVGHVYIAHAASDAVRKINQCVRPAWRYYLLF
jgi:hypothetical protein